MTITQEMNNSEMSMQNIINFACLFFGRERIKKDQWGQKNIKKVYCQRILFGWERIKKNHTSVKGNFSDAQQLFVNSYYL